MRSARRADGALAAGAAALVALGLRAAWFEPRRLVLRTHALHLPQWPAALDGVRLALISDLHAGGPHVDPSAVARVVGRTNRQRPDLVAVLGDVIDPSLMGGHPVSPESVARELGVLDAPLGVVAVLGNHDGLNDPGRVARSLADAGILVLQNGSTEIVVRGLSLFVVGVEDLTTGDPDLGTTLAGVPVGAPTLLLSHDPDLFPRVPSRVSLTVAGHTHGGQINLPLVRGRVIPSRSGDRYARGHVVEDGRHLYVTSGIGTSRWPIRLRRPPEVVILELRSP